jgi:hypothetical protein
MSIGNREGAHQGACGLWPTDARNDGSSVGSTSQAAILSKLNAMPRPKPGTRWVVGVAVGPCCLSLLP